MEPIGVALEGEWSSLSGMYTSEEADFLEQLLGNNDSSSSLGVLSSFWSSQKSEMNMAGGNGGLVDTNFYNFSQGSSSYSGGSSSQSYYFSDSHPVSMAMDFCVGDVTNTASYLVEGNDCSNRDMRNGNVEESGGNQQPAAADLPDNCLLPKKEHEMLTPETSTEDKSNSPSEISKKRSRREGDVSTRNRI